MKYIAIDIGNVLCDVATIPFLETLSDSFNITVPEARRFLKRFQQLHDLGYTTMEDELRDNFNVRSPVVLKRIGQIWNDSVIPNLPMINKLNKLRRQHNLQVALLSNIGVEHAAMIEEKLSHGGFFPNAIKHFSCFVGARKPSLIFYQSFLIQHPDFKSCLYIDDLQENLNASKQFGFNPFRLALDEADANDKIEELEQLIEKTPEILVTYDISYG